MSRPAQQPLPRDPEVRELALRKALADAILDASLDSIITIDQDSRILEWNAAAESTFGYARHEVIGQDLTELIIPPELREAHRAGMARYILTREGPVIGRRVELDGVTRDGRRLPLELAISPITVAGRLLFTAYLRDISDRRRWEARQRLLLNELNHRVKNTLATVQSIAAQTRRSVADPDAAYDAFVERLVALSGAHDVLTAEEWQGADLARIVAGALRPFGGAESGRFEIRGGPVWLPPQPAVAFAMALHELATNAAKYGALKAPQGRVTIAWTVEGPPGAEVLDFSWRERGGPAVSLPERRGFGSRLLERGLASELAGEVRLDYRPDGLVCTVRAPIARLAAERLNA